jgi:hypothetical protein
VLEKTEYKALYNATGKGKMGARARAILQLMYHCGLRREEVRLLELADVNFNTKRIHLKHGTKGNKDRILFMDGNTVAAVREWSEHRFTILHHLKALETPLLFVSGKGKVLAPSFFNQMLNRLAKKAHIRGGKVHPHLLRHTALTNLYEKSGHDIRLIQEIAGHSNVQTTQIYTHVSAARVREAMTEYSTPKTRNDNTETSSREMQKLNHSLVAFQQAKEAVQQQQAILDSILGGKTLEELMESLLTKELLAAKQVPLWVAKAFIEHEQQGLWTKELLAAKEKTARMAKEMAQQHKEGQEALQQLKVWKDILETTKN